MTSNTAAANGAIESRVVRNGDVDLAVRVVGEGPLVICNHGFPETGLTWEPMLLRLADAGYQAVAPDLRGMGESSVPAEQCSYSIFDAVADVLAVADSFDAERFHVVGNDLGAILAWHTALLHPERTQSVTGVSLPYFKPGELAPLELLALLSTSTHSPYLVRFAEPDSHLEMEADPAGWIRGCIGTVSGEVPADQRTDAMVQHGQPVHSVFRDVPFDFLHERDLDALGESYAQTGFLGAMHWYRALNADFDRLQPWASARIAPPSQFIGGEADPVTTVLTRGPFDELQYVTEDLRCFTWLADVGHWPHLEATERTAALLVDLFRHAD